jgi:hypothetical protein
MWLSEQEGAVMRFRFQRGGLKESLETTINVSSQQELRDHINKHGGLLDQLVPYDRIVFIAQPTFSQAMRDQGRWETHLVTINGQAMGYSDGTLPYEPPVERRATAPANRLPTKFDPREFQAMLSGNQSIKVADLSHHDAMQMLCMAMTVITRLEEGTTADKNLISDWHKGKIEPNPTVHEEVREILKQAKDRIDAEIAPLTSYMDQAREKIISAIDAVNAAERQPKE